MATAVSDCCITLLLLNGKFHCFRPNLLRTNLIAYTPNLFTLKETLYQHAISEVRYSRGPLFRGKTLFRGSLYAVERISHSICIIPQSNFVYEADFCEHCITLKISTSFSVILFFSTDMSDTNEE